MCNEVLTEVHLQVPMAIANGTYSADTITRCHVSAITFCIIIISACLGADYRLRCPKSTACRNNGKSITQVESVRLLNVDTP